MSGDEKPNTHHDECGALVDENCQRLSVRPGGLRVIRVGYGKGVASSIQGTGAQKWRATCLSGCSRSSATTSARSAPCRRRQRYRDVRSSCWDSRAPRRRRRTRFPTPGAGRRYRSPDPEPERWRRLATSRTGRSAADVFCCSRPCSGCIRSWRSCSLVGCQGPRLVGAEHIDHIVDASGIARYHVVIAGESPIDAAKVPPVKERTETLDRDWAEEPAFAGAPMTAAPTTRTSAA